VPVLRERCFHHPEREAAARCPGCRRFYCRECVTEHAGRVLCAACLRDRSRTAVPRALRLGRLFAAAPFLLALLLLWLGFYGAGRLLLAVPSQFHDGTVWEQTWERAQ
jgi:hypothetical protein